MFSGWSKWNLGIDAEDTDSTDTETDKGKNADQSKDKKKKQPGKGAPAKLYVRNKNSIEFSLVMSPTKKRVK